MSDLQPKYAASYERQSVDYEDGIDAQYRINRERAERDGYVIPDSPAFRFSDNRVSGDATRRKGWQRMMDLIAGGEAPFERVYVKDRTRFGRWRDPRRHFHYELKCEDRGVRIIYSTELHQVDYRDGLTPEAQGQFFSTSFKGAQTATEVLQLSERVRMGHRSRVLSGFYPGSRPPFGLERWLVNARTGEYLRRAEPGDRTKVEGHYQRLRWKDDGSRDTVKRIFELILDGYGSQPIAQILTNEGRPSGHRPGWTRNAVLRIARQPLYAGTLVWGRRGPGGPRKVVDVEEARVNSYDAVRVRGFFDDAVVDESTFEAVQRVLAGNRERWHQRHATSPSYLLTGILRCSDCGASYHGNVARKPDGTFGYRYYRHAAYRSVRREETCSWQGKAIRSRPVEEAVQAILHECLDHEKLVAAVETLVDERLADAEADDDAHLAPMRKRREALEAKLNRLIDDRTEVFMEGPAARVSAAKIQEVSGQIQDLDAQIAAVESRADRLAAARRKRTQLVDTARQLRAVFDESDMRRKKELLAHLVQRVELDLGTADLRVHLRIL